MYFCPICSYLLDISKSSNKADIEDTITINNTDELFKLLSSTQDEVIQNLLIKYAMFFNSFYQLNTSDNIKGFINRHLIKIQMIKYF